MKTKEELNALKEEVETLNKKLAELSEDELEQVTGGVIFHKQIGKYCKYCDAETSQTYRGDGFGWSSGKAFMCDLYECNVCHNTNYWIFDTDTLL